MAALAAAQSLRCANRRGRGAVGAGLLLTCAGRSPALLSFAQPQPRVARREAGLNRRDLGRHYNGRSARSFLPGFRWIARFTAAARFRTSMRNAPAPSTRGLRFSGSVGRVPDHGEDVVVILPGGTPEIGVEFARAEFRCRQAQRDVGRAGVLDWCAATPHRSQRHW